MPQKATFPTTFTHIPLPCFFTYICINTQENKSFIRSVNIELSITLTHKGSCPIALLIKHLLESSATANTLKLIDRITIHSVNRQTVPNTETSNIVHGPDDFRRTFLLIKAPHDFSIKYTLKFKKHRGSPMSGFVFGLQSHLK